MGKTYLFLADGFEEIEALTPVDLLRRAGIDVVTVSINSSAVVTGAHGIKVTADILLPQADTSSTDMLIAPGGMPGAKHLADNMTVRAAFASQASKGGYIAAICAAPAVLLASAGILNGKNATCYPGFEEALTAGGANHVAGRVVKDGNVITSNGPSSATLFALELIKCIAGTEKADEVAAGILL